MRRAWRPYMHRGVVPARNIEWVKTCSQPSWSKRQKGSRAKYRGRKFEQKVSKALQAKYGRDWCPEAWFRFKERGKSVRYCGVDGIIWLAERSVAVVVEIKLRICPDAYFQLRDLYLPVVRKAFKDDIQLAPLVLCRWYDRMEKFPVRYVKLEDETQAPIDRIAVKPWNPNRPI